MFGRAKVNHTIVGVIVEIQAQGVVDQVLPGKDMLEAAFAEDVLQEAICQEAIVLEDVFPAVVCPEAFAQAVIVPEAVTGWQSSYWPTWTSIWLSWASRPTPPPPITNFKMRKIKRRIR